MPKRSAGFEITPIRDGTLGESFEMVNNRRFKDGFLYKELLLRSLDTNNVTPSIEEMKKFKGQSTNIDISSIGRAKAQKQSTLNKVIKLL